MCGIILHNLLMIPRIVQFFFDRHTVYHLEVSMFVNVYQVCLCWSKFYGLNVKFLKMIPLNESCLNTLSILIARVHTYTVCSEKRHIFNTQVHSYLKVFGFF